MEAGTPPHTQHLRHLLPDRAPRQPRPQVLHALLHPGRGKGFSPPTQTYYRDNDEKLLSTHRLKLESSGEDTIVSFPSSFPANDSFPSSLNAVRPQTRSQEELLLGLQGGLPGLPRGNCRPTQHVKEDPHKQQLRSNKFSKYILETELDFRNRKEEPKDIISLDSKLLDETNELDKNSRPLNRPAL